MVIGSSIPAVGAAGAIMASRTAGRRECGTLRVNTRGPQECHNISWP